MHAACIEHISMQNKHLGDYNHGVGSSRTTTHHASSFLLHTPAAALHSSIIIPSGSYHRTQTPASILSKQRLSKQRPTTAMQAVTTTPLRGDQQPQIDDDNPQQEIQVFVPLVVKNQPVTVIPIYFTNERDKPFKRIH